MKLSAWLDRHMKWILFGPAVLVMAAIFLYPLAYAFNLSLHDWSFFTLNDPPFVGLRNYGNTLRDLELWSALGKTGIFVGIGLILQFSIGMALALGVDKLGRQGGLLTTLLVMPMMVTPVVVGLGWKFILDYNFGIFNYVRTVLGLQPVAVLSSSRWALLTMTLVDTWQWTPFIFLVLLAGLRSLPHEPYEAAIVDGAGPWHIFSRITVPLLKPVLVVALVMRMAGAAKVFDHIFVLTGGGPGTATEVVSLHLYRKAFQSYEMGYASAVALLLTLLIALISWWAMRTLYAESET